MKTEEDSAKVGFPPPFIYLGALIAGIGIGLLPGVPSLGLPDGLRYVGGAALLLVGAGLLLAAASRFRSSGTNVEPWKPVSTIVSVGPYRWTRNPMYLGMALVYAGIALACGSLTALVLLPIVLAIVQTRVIAREERYLETKFGEDYRRYKAGVRRWL
jgi:protein-S-isoprenylcysteine O-methyltransferase Ste14